MSFTDDAAQASDAQGQESSSSAPYAEYLNRLPENVRGEVEPIFKEWDSNTTRKFQEAAEFRKQWEPLQETGIGNLAPEQAQWLSQFWSVMNENPAAIKDWYQEFAQSNNLLDEIEAAEDEFEYEDPNVNALLEKRLAPIMQQLEQMGGNWQQIQEQARIQERQSEIDATLSEIEKENPDTFDREVIDLCVANHMDKQPKLAVQAAWKDAQGLIGRFQKGVFTSKQGLGLAPESGGSADGSPDEIKLATSGNQWKEINALATARLKEANRAG